jgi:hypothetical protein
MAEIEDERERFIDLWQGRGQQHKDTMLGVERYRRGQEDQSAYEQAANKGWLDRAAEGAAVGTGMYPGIGTLIGTGAGALAGILEGGFAAEGAGYKDPWAHAMIPISIDPTSGNAPSLSGASGGLQALMGAGTGLNQPAALQYLSGQGAPGAGPGENELLKDFRFSGGGGGGPQLEPPVDLKHGGAPGFKFSDTRKLKKPTY